MRSFYLVVLGLMATSSLAAPKKAAQEGISAFEAMAKLKSGPHVYVHIADDGVARAYDENESVIDYVPLTNDQLKQLLANLPEPWKKEADHLHTVFDDVDGRQVTDEKQLLDPPAELRNPMPRQAPQSKRAPDPLQQHKDDEPSPFPPLRHSPSNKGFNHLATDGVIRSFSSSGEVIDYKQSSPAEIAKMLEFFGKYMDPEAFEEVRKKFEGVDGRNVTDLEQLLHPGPGIGPERFKK
ncbi:uncharacterized protein P174DRAFT_463260 [Aspergillus novofumigatus IBT 16806]|uniref:Uncharacterized protein n=1 Tax=Aspergillus novofumigatus (strain IBT 16806) TaxID=1392255 RepID=A0A2I1C0F9_ASPN1|nr:uncharacterized protein P174DRAFT_463260 [Aspergillus novofumigatus IBT 16806]PKX91118.1 hypothetical protein P174DRAFT_463260 [Aspergillus novofumigatus IBT 16806]